VHAASGRPDKSSPGNQTPRTRAGCLILCIPVAHRWSTAVSFVVGGTPENPKCREFLSGSLLYLANVDSEWRRWG
jgi:hypothetical protein